MDTSQFILCTSGLELRLRGNPLTLGYIEIFVRQSMFFFFLINSLLKNNPLPAIGMLVVSISIVKVLFQRHGKEKISTNVPLLQHNKLHFDNLISIFM